MQFDYIHYMTTNVGHSSYWLRENLSRHTDRTSPAFLLKMAAIKRAIGGYVRIVTKRDIPVRWSTGQQSYATAKDQIIISGRANPEDLDIMVGLALHEATHIRLSKVTFDPDSLPMYDVLTALGNRAHAFITPTMQRNMDRLNLSVNDCARHIKLMLNLIEDRRIDKWSYQKFPGYRPYYDALYKDSFYCKSVDTGLQAPYTHRPILRFYEFHIINFTNKHANPDALPGLREIRELIDLPNIERFVGDGRWDTWERDAINIVTYRYDWDKLPDLVSTALHMVEILYANAHNSEDVPADDEMPKLSAPHDPDNLDINEDADDELTPDELDAVITRLINIVNGTDEKETLAATISEALSALEGASTTLFTAGDDSVGKCNVIVYNTVTPALLAHPSCPFGTSAHSPPLTALLHAVSAGTRLGDMLADQLVIMGDDDRVISNRRVTGTLDKRRISGLGYDIDTVFQHTTVGQYAPVLLHLSIDSSGSMAGDKWTKAITLATAFAKAAEKVNKLNVVISLRTGMDAAFVGIVYDSRVDVFAKARTMFPRLVAHGGTPEGLTFQAIKSQLEQSGTGAKRYFVNISDGEPTHAWTDSNDRHHVYSGQSAFAHTAHQVAAIERSGNTVLSYFVGNPADTTRVNFKSMYGKSARFIDTSKVTEIARTLNAMFLSNR